MSAVYRNGRYERLLLRQSQHIRDIMQRLRDLEMKLMALTGATEHIRMAYNAHSENLNDLNGMVDMIVDPEHRIPRFQDFPRAFGKGRKND